MSRFPSLPEQPHLGDALQRFGRSVWPLCEMNNLDNPAPYRAFARQLGFSPEPMDLHATKLP